MFKCKNVYEKDNQKKSWPVKGDDKIVPVSYPASFFPTYIGSDKTTTNLNPKKN